MDQALKLPSQNDILSYAKEQAEGVPHNLITVFRAKGVLTQRAFDMAERDVEAMLRRLVSCSSSAPTFRRSY